LRKRVSALILSICMALSLTTMAQAAGAELTVNAPDELPAVGETFTVTVDISGNPGITAAQFTLTFDESVLECADVNTGSALNGAMAATNPSADKGAVVAAASAREMTADGALATFSFKVIGEGTPDYGVADITISNAEGDVIDLKVNGAEVQEPEEEPEPVQPEKPKEDPKPEPEPVKPEKVEPEKPVKEEAEASRFTDTADHPYEYYINEAVDMGIFQGYADGSFGPDRSVTRGAYVTVLWRLAGRPEPTRATPFTDIGGVSTEFQLAIAWAYENGLISGRTATTFAPGDPVSRQAALKILYYYNGGVDNVLPMYKTLYQSGFVDCQGKPDWVQTSMFWGYYNQLIDSVTESTLEPAVNATRAQLAMMFVNYADQFGV